MFGKFMGSAAIAALCAAVMLIPALLTLLNGYTGLSGFKLTPSLYFWNPLEPVSYTHLDVYKRQAQLCWDSDQCPDFLWPFL